MKRLKVLVACEESGTVREAFRRLGHDAWSCDLLPSAISGQHYERDTISEEGHMDEELLTEDEKNELKIRLKQEKKKIIDSIIIHRHDQDGLEPIR